MPVEDVPATAQSMSYLSKSRSNTQPADDEPPTRPQTVLGTATVHLYRGGLLWASPCRGFRFAYFRFDRSDSLLVLNNQIIFLNSNFVSLLLYFLEQPNHDAVSNYDLLQLSSYWRNFLLQVTHFFCLFLCFVQTHIAYVGCVALEKHRLIVLAQSCLLTMFEHEITDGIASNRNTTQMYYLKNNKINNNNKLYTEVKEC